jgi:hypothetical protein
MLPEFGNRIFICALHGRTATQFICQKQSLNIIKMKKLRIQQMLLSLVLLIVGSVLEGSLNLFGVPKETVGEYAVIIGAMTFTIFTVRFFRENKNEI